MNGILCFGGSFNPIHHGHLICAIAVAEAIGADRIRLIPSGIPPHKTVDPSLASAADRLAMTRLAVAGDDRFEVDPQEIQRTGAGYTIDTVRSLRAEGIMRIYWLIGADMARTLPTWREPRALMDEGELLIVDRPGFPIDWSALPGWMAPLRKNVVSAPLIQISATAIRQRVAASLPIHYLTPLAVASYIAEHGLYKTT